MYMYVHYVYIYMYMHLEHIYVHVSCGKLNFVHLLFQPTKYGVTNHIVHVVHMLYMYTCTLYRYIVHVLCNS